MRNRFLCVMRTRGEKHIYREKKNVIGVENLVSTYLKEKGKNERKEEFRCCFVAVYTQVVKFVIRVNNIMCVLVSVCYMWISHVETTKNDTLYRKGL